MYQSVPLKLDEMITKTYPVDEIDRGCRDLVGGRNVRGVITYDW